MRRGRRVEQLPQARAAAARPGLGVGLGVGLGGGRRRVAVIRRRRGGGGGDGRAVGALLRLGADRLRRDKLVQARLVDEGADRREGLHRPRDERDEERLPLGRRRRIGDRPIGEERQLHGEEDERRRGGGAASGVGGGRRGWRGGLRLLIELLQVDCRRLRGLLRLLVALASCARDAHPPCLGVRRVLPARLRLGLRLGHLGLSSSSRAPSPGGAAATRWSAAAPPIGRGPRSIPSAGSAVAAERPTPPPPLPVRAASAGPAGPSGRLPRRRRPRRVRIAGHRHARVHVAQVGEGRHEEVEQSDSTIPCTHRTYRAERSHSFRSCARCWKERRAAGTLYTAP